MSVRSTRSRTLKHANRRVSHTVAVTIPPWVRFQEPPWRPLSLVHVLHQGYAYTQGGVYLPLHNTLHAPGVAVVIEECEVRHITAVAYSGAYRAVMHKTIPGLEPPTGRQPSVR